MIVPPSTDPEAPMPTHEAHEAARMPLELRDTVRRIAEHHGRNLSEEIRRALTLWTYIAATAHLNDADVVGAIGTTELLERLRVLRLAATNAIGDGFPTAEPEAVLAALAPAPPPRSFVNMNPSQKLTPHDEPTASAA